MLNFVLLVLILLVMIIPVAIIGALGLALNGVSSLDLSIVDFYIMIAPTHALAVLVIAEVAVVAAAAYLIGYTHIRWLTV
jgi:hypothetical protein